MASRQHGFTLIELMVTIVVLAILLMVAIPSFNDFRRRAAIRGAADQISSFWADAKFEAVRRNTFVKVGFVTNANNDICLGAATTTDPADDAACDCFSASACNVSRYPSDQSEWQRVLPLNLPDLGDSDSDSQGVAVIDPKRGNLTQSSDAGGIALKSPSGGPVYQVKVVIDRNGRPVQCEPSGAAAKLPQFTGRACGT